MVIEMIGVEMEGGREWKVGGSGEASNKIKKIWQKRELRGDQDLQVMLDSLLWLKEQQRWNSNSVSPNLHVVCLPF
jgi:hypothetical protein